MESKIYNIKVLTIQEVADFLRVHRSTVSRYAQSGELKSYLVGSRRLFKETDVVMFFEKQAACGCVFGGESNGNCNNPKT